MKEKFPVVIALFLLIGIVELLFIGIPRMETPEITFSKIGIMLIVNYASAYITVAGTMEERA